MSSTETRYEHIVLNEAGIPIIAGTTMNVVELVLEQHAYGWSPEELHVQHSYLMPGQISLALAYYREHQDEVEQNIQERFSKVEAIRNAVRTAPLQARLAALKSR